VPIISTASLPDIIFILLFFFMVVTVMRPPNLMLKFTIPQATELVKLENKRLIHTIYVGTPIAKLKDKMGTAPLLQLDNKLSTPKEIRTFVEHKREAVSP